MEEEIMFYGEYDTYYTFIVESSITIEDYWVLFDYKGDSYKIPRDRIIWIKTIGGTEKRL